MTDAKGEGCIRTHLRGQSAAHIAHEVVADMPRLYGHLMACRVHGNGIDAEALLSSLFRRYDDRAVILQRPVGGNRRFNDPLLLQFLPAQVFRNGMYQCQAEIAARDFLHRAGEGLQDAQAVTSPCCGVGFIDTDHRRSPPSKGYKESASEETLLQVEK